MTAHDRHLRLVPDPPSTDRPAQLTFGVLTADQRGETASVDGLRPAREVLAEELEPIAQRLRARGGLV